MFVMNVNILYKAKSASCTFDLYKTTEELGLHVFFLNLKIA